MLLCSLFALVVHPLFLIIGLDFYTEEPFIIIHIVLTYIIVGTLIWMLAGEKYGGNKVCTYLFASTLCWPLY